MFLTGTLKNGIRVIAEKNPTLHSVTVGFWVRAGQRDEGNGEEGISHFIEHMLFKGTDKRSAKDISVAFDSIGGQINAFTAKEYTCFYARSMDQDLDQVLDILSDMLQNPKLDAEEMKREQGVVIEEINMVDDTPEDLVHDLLSEAYFGPHPLAKPILGTKKSVAALNAELIRDYMNRHYVPQNIVVALSGNFDFDHVMEELEKLLCDWPYNGNQADKLSMIWPEQKNLTVTRKTEQLHICLGFRGIAQDDELLYPMMVFNNIFGGGMSSRLFQEIREERGLAYSVYSYSSQYRDCGMFTVYGGMTLQQADAVAKIVHQQMEDVLAGGITDEELQRSRNQLRGNYILGSESSSNRMMAIGRSYLTTGKVRTPQEVLDAIAAVNMDQIMTTAKLCFEKAPAIAAIGPKAGVKAALDAFEV